MELNHPVKTPELRRIIFLDIDGVVLPLSQPTRRRYEDYAHDQIPQPLQRLVALLDEFPIIELVLSSSWRVDADIERARELLPMRHRQRLIGTTPLIDNGSDRGKECLRWLATHGDGALVAILDDCCQLFSSDFQQLVLVEASTGIDDESILAVRQLLRLLGPDTHHEGFPAECSRQSRVAAAHGIKLQNPTCQLSIDQERSQLVKDRSSKAEPASLEI